MILLQEGGFALGKLLPDPGEQLTSLPPLLGSERGGVDVVAVFPHLPDHQPPLPDQFGGPGAACFLASQVRVMRMLGLDELLGHPAQQEVFPSDSVLLLNGLSDCPRALDKIPILQSGHRTDSHSEAGKRGRRGYSPHCMVFSVGRGTKKKMTSDRTKRETIQTHLLSNVTMTGRTADSMEGRAGAEGIRNPCNRYPHRSKALDEVLRL